MTPFRILHEDTHLIVLDKAPGVLSQGGPSDSREDENLVDLLRGHFGRNYVGLIHRLDRNTSGLMVVAKRSKSANRLTSALQSGKLERSYLAWIEGALSAPAKWRHHLVKDEKRNLVRAWNEQRAGSKPASLTVTPVRTGTWHGDILTLSEFVLETGRSHQIRAQSAAMNHALLGDRKYGSRHPDFGRPALHSHRIRFPHPMGGEVMEFTAPLPPDMCQEGLRNQPSEI